MAKCYIHNDHEAVMVCEKCNKGICSSCAPRYEEEQKICPVCAKAIVQKEKKNYLLINILLAVAIVAAIALETYIVCEAVRLGLEANFWKMLLLTAVVLACLGFLIFSMINAIKIFAYNSQRLKIAESYNLNTTSTVTTTTVEAPIKKEVTTTTSSTTKKVSKPATTTASVKEPAKATKSVSTSKPVTAKQVATKSAKSADTTKSKSTTKTTTKTATKKAVK